MRVCFSQAIGLLFVFAACIAHGEQPSGRPATLPENESVELYAPIKDLTPVELTKPVEAVELPEAPKSGGLYGSAEFLLMRPRQRGLDYAIVDPKNDLVPQGNLQSARFEMNSGLRVGLGYRVPDSCWEVGFTYTYLHSQGHSGAAAPDGGLLYPELTRPGLTDSALTAIANARLGYNVFDLEFARTIDVDEWMQVRLFSGIRFASIQQTLSARYDGMLADSAFAQSRSNFDGAGPMFGAETRWRLRPGLSLFGRLSGGLIYGNVRSSLTETNNGGATLYADIADRNRQIVPVVGMGLGVAWEYRGLTFRAGYEAVNWFGLIERPTLTNDFSEGKLLPRLNDLSIDGFFLQLAFAY